MACNSQRQLNIPYIFIFDFYPTAKPITRPYKYFDIDIGKILLLLFFLPSENSCGSKNKNAKKKTINIKKTWNNSIQFNFNIGKLRTSEFDIQMERF